MVFDTTILGSNPSAPAKLMKKLSLNSTIFFKIKKKLFPFYKQKKIKELFNLLEKNQEQKSVAMFVGGAVRRFITDKDIDDIDIATIFTPEELKKKFHNTNFNLIETGLLHGSITLINGEDKYEITTLRKDLETDGRHAEVEFTDNWQQDSNRRDFTINAIYLNKDGKIYDPQSGLKDLNNNIVKFIGDPTKRIEEDYLRIIRYVRFSLEYKSGLDQSTVKAIKLSINGIKNLSKERILSELFKILSLDNFFQIEEKNDLKKIFLLIFPEFKHIDRLNKYKLINHNVEFTKDIILGILLIDETDNHQYFCHKYKTSNQIKEKLELFKDLYFKYNDDKHFFKTNMQKNIYKFGKTNIKKINLLLFFINKKYKLDDYLKNNLEIKNTLLPKFPYDGRYLINKGLVEGKKLGLALKELEGKWINNNFTISEEDIDSIISKNNS